MTSQQKLVPVFVFVVLAAAIGYALLPFRFADAVNCGPPLLGAKAKTKTVSSRGFIKPEEDCLAAGKSRLTVSAVVAFIAVLAGTAMVGLQPLSQECLSGGHDDCTEWWPNIAGGLGERLGCQCDCHSAAW
ncbi:MAG: hypothetical protein ACRD0Q_05250 [Acidimicrobiales bacterium]